MGTRTMSSYEALKHIRQCAEVVGSSHANVSVDMIDSVLQDLSALRDIVDAASRVPNRVTDGSVAGFDWLDLPDASIAMGVSERTIRRRIRSGSVDARMRRGRRQVYVRLPIFAANGREGAQ